MDDEEEEFHDETARPEGEDLMMKNSIVKGITVGQTASDQTSIEQTTVQIVDEQSTTTQTTSELDVA